MKFQDDISNMNTYVRTYIHTYIRTSRNQYVPFFFKVGGIIKGCYVLTAGNVVRGNQKLCMLNPYESFRT